MDVSGWIAHWAGWTSAKPALRFEGSEIGYAELERDAGLLAGWLRANETAAGDRVGYLGPNCPELLELLFACARVGAILVPLNSWMPPAELSVFVRATRPRLLVAEESFVELALKTVGDAARDCVKEFSAGVGLAPFADAAEPVSSSSDVGPGTPALILFTSGTTGRPKGATFTHQNLMFNALNVITAVGLTSADEILTAVPMVHAGGLLIHTLPALCAGATITIHRQFEPAGLLDEIQRRRISLLACVPTMTAALAADPAWQAADLSSLRCVVTGSTVVPYRAIEPWRRKGVPLVQGYGSTEACPTAVTMPPGSPPEAALTAGKPSLYTQLRIVDQSGDDAPEDEPGEVWLRGPAVTAGYWENEQATREAFSDGWFRTGDLGVLDETGCLQIVGRIKDIIIIGGYNVHPADLETVLDGCAEIREAAVVGKPHEELDEVPVAFVVPVAGSALSADRVLALFRGRLAGYKHPREVRFVDALPRNRTGKIDRSALRELVATASDEPRAGVEHDAHRRAVAAGHRSAPGDSPTGEPLANTPADRAPRTSTARSHGVASGPIDNAPVPTLGQMSADARHHRGLRGRDRDRTDR